LTNYGDWRFEGPLSVEQAKALVADGFSSAIGHKDASAFLSALLGVDVPVNRVSVELQAGDRALVLRLKARMPEGKVLTREEMTRLPFELGLLSKLR
jgi:hypothetical protein